MEGLKDKTWNYHGSDKSYYSGITINSGTSWQFINFSGTFTGFGTESNERNHRFAIVSSGASYMEWSYNNGSSQAGEVWNGNAITQDGVNISGVFLRSKTDAQKVQVFAW